MLWPDRRYDPHEDVYDVLTHFQGPFAIQPVMAMALQVPSSRLRIRTPPDSGGSFGVKQGVAPYAVLMAVAPGLQSARSNGSKTGWSI